MNPINLISDLTKKEKRKVLFALNELIERYEAAACGDQEAQLRVMHDFGKREYCPLCQLNVDCTFCPAFWYCGGCSHGQLQHSYIVLRYFLTLPHKKWYPQMSTVLKKRVQIYEEIRDDLTRRWNLK